MKALHLRRLLRQDFSRLFRIPHIQRAGEAAPKGGVDILLHPTATSTAPVHPSAAARPGAGSTEATSEYLQDILTVPASLAGLPSMSVPGGKGPDGWPAGVTLTGQFGTEDLLFWAGKGVESWSRETTS